MTPPRWLRMAPAVLVVLATTVAAAPPQDDCPPQSRSPQCTGSTDDGDTTSGGGSTQAPDSTQTPDRGQAPTTPPGQEPDPAPEEPADPRPDRGADSPSTGTTDEAPTSPSGPPRRTTPDASSDDTPGAGDPSGDDEEEEAAEATVPAPPPDLGARRVLATRLTAGPAGLQVAVDVEEARARGVDGGWTVTITGAPGVDTSVDARSLLPDGPVGLIIGRTPQRLDAPRGFTVVGQRSTTVYDASYSGRLPFAPLPSDGPAVITVTLFQ